MPGLGTSFGRGGATTFVQDLVNADCILIEGSNFAECHPVAFRFVMKAKERGATIVHVDPRFTRTSAMADVYAMGVVLWELLAGRRLFQADNDPALLKVVLAGAKEPPGRYAPHVPAALDALVMRALAPDPS